jgi:DNA-binding transcriptional MerR regulator
MNIYTPSEICSKLNGITPRQITDLAEKKIIIPAKDTPGQGSMRLYDKKNIRDIMIALALRGYIVGEALKRILKKVNECDQRLIEISINPGATKRDGYVTWIIPTDDTRKKLKMGVGIKTPERAENPKDFTTILVDVSAIDYFIKEKF